MQERTKLTSDKASVNEVKLQAHTTLLQTQLDNEISLRCVCMDHRGWVCLIRECQNFMGWEQYRSEGFIPYTWGHVGPLIPHLVGSHCV